MSEQARWQEASGYSDLSVAVDEIYALRALLAHEADVIRAHLELATFPKSRRRFAEQQMQRMRAAAAGDYRAAWRDGEYDNKRALKRLGLDDCLTNAQWAEQRGLIATTDRSAQVGD